MRVLILYGRITVGGGACRIPGPEPAGLHTVRTGTAAFGPVACTEGWQRTAACTVVEKGPWAAVHTPHIPVVHLQIRGGKINASINITVMIRPLVYVSIPVS